VSDSEERCNFVKRFIFRFRNFFVGEDPEECKEDAEGEEGVVLQSRLHRGEPDPHKEVGTPEFEKKNWVMGCLRVNFTNILQAAFASIFSAKNYKPKLKSYKSCAKNFCMEKSSS